MMPVRSVFKLKLPNSGWSSMAMNIVGTPCSTVQRSSATVCSVLSASKPSSGKTMVEPCVRQARLPSTMPKQWYSGTGIHKRSAGVSCMASPTK